MSKTNEIIKGANALSLGISMVVAVFLGIGLGYLLKKFTGIGFLFWIGVGFGIIAAILNVYKAYKTQLSSLDELKNDPKYKNLKYEEDKEDDE
ncbi:arginine biosynthesis bifunctional protein ArgJ [Campylobacter sputorum subsp. bubulus]|uniref:Arginine biosynthesis bifunctional protein ArgJ n=1 Tax=Campylobacter sputorum subsp. sputorum TaxID=32024 RepID=A0A381DL92_9BACT|nr:MULTISPECIES: AtpZ/AtpI family protein [Campylobacter]ASM34770.1 putative ATPase-related protein [Campylobacter sputorum aubsp. sputorum RM3237]ASM36433.1 putative ATPase-related protein [Campylobacter sputorum bv. faecalis CCUG 20703]ASM38130.1 putative ATPase-related protein [Campylobacter sputorum bv. paraureolyticus LMG 11764]KAB0581673.1 AtpZ/AtpI family protein [Campylobacter sputorum subsp. sputorum]MBE7358041.1 AtpZ/AtpI family protein [Campylobacter sp. RM11302]